MLSWTVLAAPVILLVAYVINRLRKRHSSKLPLPPAPPGLPVVGNLPEFLKAVSKNSQHLLLDGWARKYGEIVRVEMATTTLYYLNSDVAVKALFDKQSAATAQRPRWIVSNELLANKSNVLLLDASEPRWKSQRKAITNGLTSPERADAGLPFLHYETARFLHELYHSPSSGATPPDLYALIGPYTYSTFALQSIGMEIPTVDNAAMHYIHQLGLDQILGTLPGSYVVDILPVLEHLPVFMKPWERWARKKYRADRALADKTLERVRAEMQAGTAHDAFLQKALAHEKRHGLESDEEAAYLALNLILAAADTSRMSTWSFLEAMMTFPDVQRRARQAVDAHVGTERLPVYADLEAVPFVRCLMKEVWRWRPPVALGHPHTTTKELAYAGMRILKGARLHLNAWAIGHDPRRHKDPEEFMPERYEDDATTTAQSINSADPMKRDHFAFGAGRRVCPGYHVAERSLAVAMMRLLWAFEISAKPGTVLPLDVERYGEAIPGNMSKEMPVVLTPRGGERARVIEEAVERGRQESGDVQVFEMF